MARTLIHLGMPRAASTFFQREVWPFLEGFQYAGVDRCQYSRAFQQMLFQDDSLFDSDAFAHSTAELRRSDALLSNELFVGQSLYFCSTTRSRTLERLAAAFPEAEAVIILRRQVDLLESLYSLAVYAGFSKGPSDFLHPSPIPLAQGQPDIYPTYEQGEHLESYLYQPLLALCNKHFSKVHLFFYEDFAEDAEAFCEALCSRLELSYSRKPHFSRKVNRSFTRMQLRFMRRLNLWKDLHHASSLGSGLFRRKVRFIEKYMGWGQRFGFSSEVREALHEYYEPDLKAVYADLPEGSTLEGFRKHYLS